MLSIFVVALNLRDYRYEYASEGQCERNHEMARHIVLELIIFMYYFKNEK